MPGKSSKESSRLFRFRSFRFLEKRSSSESSTTSGSSLSRWRLPVPSLIFFRSHLFSFPVVFSRSSSEDLGYDELSLKGLIVERSDFKRMPNKYQQLLSTKLARPGGKLWTKFLVFERRVSGFWMDSDKAWLRLDPKIWLEGGPRNLSVLLRLFGTGRNLDF